jgi:hypothetical protein
MVLEYDFTEFMQKCYNIMPDRWKQVYENQGGVIDAWYPKLTITQGLKISYTN